MILPEQAPRTLALTGDVNGCTWWRITSPMSELYRRGYPCYVGRKDQDTSAYIDGMDAITLPRLSWKAQDQQLGLDWRARLHESGIAMIFEWDDDVFAERIVRRAHEVDDEGKSSEALEEERLARIFAVGIADGVTCSTPRLATRLRQLTDKPVKVVPNYIDLRWWRSVQATARRRLPEPVIGWAGGLRPDRDVEVMAVAWEKVARRHPEARFVVAGWQPSIFARLPASQLIRSDWLPVQQYPRNYVGVDIGCCPLADEPFNRAKSGIKWQEWSASGAAVVASPTVYGGVIEHGRTGLIADTADEWEAAIEDLLASPKRRHKMAKRALRVVERDWSLERHVTRWPMVWREIVDDTRARLGAAPTDLILPPELVGLGMVRA